jgi:hypothetical protein
MIVLHITINFRSTSSPLKLQQKFRGGGGGSGGGSDGSSGASNI